MVTSDDHFTVLDWLFTSPCQKAKQRRLWQILEQCGGHPGPVMITGVNSDTAKACGTVSITTMPMARPPPAGSGKKTTTHVESGRRTQAQRPRSLYSRVRGTGRRSRGSSPPCGT